MTSLYSKNVEIIKNTAKDEARSLRHAFVTAEHLLLGILKLSNCQASIFLRRRGVTYTKTRAKLIELMGRGTTKVDDPPRSLRNISIFHCAERFADGYEGPLMGTMHLLWAILSFETCEAAAVMVADDREAQSWREDIEDYLAQSTTRRPEILSFRSKGRKLEETNQWRKRLSSCGEELRKNIIVPDAAISRIVDTLTRSWAGLLGTSRPIASFLFVGPRGSGKYSVAQNMARFLFHDADCIYQISMADLNDESRIGHVFGDGVNESLLSVLVREFPRGILYLKDVEQAPPKVTDYLHQILATGHCTNNYGQRVDFRDHVIVLSLAIDSEFFKEANLGIRRSKIDESDTQDQYERMLMPDLEAVLRTDTMSAVDETIFFPPLNDRDQCALLDTWTADLSEELKREHNVEMLLSASLKEYLIKRSEEIGRGVGSLRRLFSREIGGFIAKALLDKEIKHGDKVEISQADGRFVITAETKNGRNGGQPH